MCKYINVFIRTNYSKIDILYTYFVPEEYREIIEVGSRVLVPFGGGDKPTFAIVVELKDEINLESQKIKPIIEPIDNNPIINKELIDLGNWMKENYLLSFNQAFTPLLPPGDQKKIATVYQVLKDIEPDIKGLKEIVYNRIKEKGSIGEIEGYSVESIKKAAKDLIKEEYIFESFEITTKIKNKTVKTVELIYQEGKTSDLRLSKKQLEILNYLKDKEEVYLKKILSDLNISDSPIKTLEKKGILKTFDKEVIRDPEFNIIKYKKNILTLEQESVYNKIINLDKRVFLIHGITGSGKTEIYLQIAEKYLDEDGQIIILVPEISLTPQMIERVSGRFGSKISILHSRLSQGERFDQWRKIKNGEVKIVVGARSAIFAPFNKLKLIVIDEEHEDSYRYNENVKYDTIEVAIKRATTFNAKVILGSGTPSVESYYKASKGEYELIELRNRINDKTPKIQVVDMREELEKGNTSIFSENLASKILQALERKEQIILFLNRRGFSNFISCRACGHVIKCESCDISMTYHKNNNLLRCHYCGSTKKVPQTCPICNSKYIRHFGIGTQRVEEEVYKFFPQAKVLRMDSDTTSSKDSYRDFYNKMKNKEVDILIGTQMLAKGLDFENVTLVGVLAADMSLYVSDYRAQENTFQLVTQVAGRAGRGKKDGEVVIQTYNPENYSIEYSHKGDYLSFYNKEINIREKFNYPPFYRIYTIYISGKDKSELKDFTLEVYKNLLQDLRDSKALHTKIITVPKIKNFYKYKIQIKVLKEDEEMLKELLKRVCITDNKLRKKDNIFLNIEM